LAISIGFLDTEQVRPENIRAVSRYAQIALGISAAAFGLLERRR
jgi:hypothetical protein